MEEQLPRVGKGRNPTLRRKWGSAFSGSKIDNVAKETHVVSPMILSLETDTRLKRERANRLLLHPIQRHRVTDKKIQRIRQQRSEILERNGQIPLPK